MKIHMPSAAELKAIKARNDRLTGGNKSLSQDEARMLPKYRYAPRSQRPPWVNARVQQLAEAENG